MTFIFLDAQWRRRSRTNRPPKPGWLSYNCFASLENPLESVYCPLVSLHRHASLPLFDAGKKMRSCNNSVEQGQWCNSNTRAVGNVKKRDLFRQCLKRRSQSMTKKLRWVTNAFDFCSPSSFQPSFASASPNAASRNKGSHLCGTFAREIMAARC